MEKFIFWHLSLDFSGRACYNQRSFILTKALMRAATTAQRLVPMPLLMPIVARQQKKKLG